MSICLAVQLAAPAPAHAWLGWLERLSGPGPWRGFDLDIRIACFVDVTTVEEAARASEAAFSLISKQTNTDLLLDQDKKIRIKDYSKIEIKDYRKLESEGHGKLIVLQNQPVSALATLDFWTGKIANRKLESPPPGTNALPSIQSMMIVLAGDFLLLAADVEHAEKSPTTTDAALKATYAEVISELRRAESLWRSATQPRISKAPGFVLDSSCSDHPKNDALLNGEQWKVGHGDRKPSPSFILNIRQLYANHDAPFAQGQKITLTAVEPKLSWPLSGRFDFLEGQVGAGRYWMSSEGFPNQVTQQGWIVEPIRFDLHVPSRFAEGRLRFLTILSYSAGIVVFPQGFPVNAFYEGSAPIAGGEAIFEQNFVINLSRFLR